MTRWNFTGKSAAPMSGRSLDNPFTHAPPQLSKWPEIKAPAREYVEHALGQRFAAYNDPIDASGESDSERESQIMNRSPNKKGRGKPDIVRVNRVPFRMHELFDAICECGTPPPDGTERTQYFEKVGGVLGFRSWDSHGRLVGDPAAARELKKVYSSYLEVLIREWNAVAQNSLNNLPHDPLAIPKPWICQSRELTWLRDALIMCNLLRSLREAAEVQRFFHLLHDLWVFQKTCREACAANSAKSKSPSFESSSANDDSPLPSIVEATLAAKLSDPHEPMRFRHAIQHLLAQGLLDVPMITFLQDIIQRDLDATKVFSPLRYNRRHHISLLRLLTRYTGDAQCLRAHLYKRISSEGLNQDALEACPRIKEGGEATLYKYQIQKATDDAVALRVARRFGRAELDSRSTESVLLAVLHKQLVHDNILEFLGVVEHRHMDGFDDVCIVTTWHADDAITYLETPANHSHLPKLMQDISKGVSYLHDSGVVHGDLHGKNILIAKPRNLNPARAIIADFGHSMCDGEDKALEKPRISAMQGHCAPELRGAQPEWPSNMSDVFACASTFVELLFGQSLDAQSYRQPLPPTAAGCRVAIIPDKKWCDFDRLIREMWCGEPMERPTIHGVHERIQKIMKFKKPETHRK